MAQLRRLPFVEVMRDGLVVHETMQQAIAGVVGSTDPERHRQLKRAAWRELRREVATVGGAELWCYTADMVFMPRKAFFPSDPQPYAVEQAQATDAGAITAVLDRYLGQTDAAAWQRWWQRLPQTFRVVREAGGSVAAFALFFRPDHRAARWLEGDAITASWAGHLAQHPLRGRGLRPAGATPRSNRPVGSSPHGRPSQMARPPPAR